MSLPTQLGWSQLGDLLGQSFPAEAEKAILEIFQPMRGWQGAGDVDFPLGQPWGREFLVPGCAARRADFPCLSFSSENTSRVLGTTELGVSCGPPWDESA